MNLIDDPWIPVATRSGRRRRIAPWQLTEDMDGDPIVMVAAPRPDFSGALLEFLIGLLQTEAAPEERRDWARWQRQPPSPVELRERLARAAPFFELFGDGPRFMQPMEPIEESGALEPIETMLIDALNTHFRKPGRVTGMCPACAAAALYTVQAYSPAGGRGHTTALRGAGPVTTIVEADPELEPERRTLWHTMWLNVLPRRRFELITGNPRLTDPQATYPWLGATRLWEHKVTTTPEDMSPYHPFWGMPRRIRLIEPGSEGGARPCDLCRAQTPLVETYFLRHGGMLYAGPWKHPLSPWRTGPQGDIRVIRVNRGGLGYRDWPQLASGTCGDESSSAPVVTEAVSDGRRVAGRARVFAFGYDVVPGQKKSRGWYECRMPTFCLPEERMRALGELGSNMVVAATEVMRNLRSALKEAWRAPKSPDFAISAFWQRTETVFYAELQAILEALANDRSGYEILHRWHRSICEAAEHLFETWAEAGDIGETDPGRIARAHRDLRRFNWKKSIRNALFLPDPKKHDTKGGTA